MAKKTYIIKYEVYNSIDIVLKHGTMKAKNKETEIEAKVGLEKFLQKSVTGFHRLVILECKEEFDYKNFFGDLFDKGNNSINDFLKGFSK
jgi:hypothetical protein